jgi:hypothetical protein
LFKQSRAVIQAIACLVFNSALAPAWSQLPTDWKAADIGGAAPEGATSVSEDGLWSLKGGGTGVAGGGDQFRFAYRELKGDGSFTARLMSLEGGDAKQARAGVMLRESDAPGALNLFAGLSAGRDGLATARGATGGDTLDLGDGLFPNSVPVYLRVQRIANEVQAFVSADGQLWRALAGPRTVALKETALLGMAASGHTAGQLATATFDSVSVEAGRVSPSGLTACGADRGALLSWRPVRGAVGYLVYRGPIDATADKLMRLTASPVAMASYVDVTPGLPNDAPVLYAVTPVLLDTNGQRVEGLPTVTATVPTATPGLAACSIAEPASRPGSVAFDAANSTLTLTATGPTIGGYVDRFFFAARSFTGDFEVTVKLLAQPGTTSSQKTRRRPAGETVPVGDPEPEAPQTATEEIVAGLMVRESLEPGSRFFMEFVSPVQGAGLLWRGAPDELTEGPEAPLIDRDKVPSPFWLRVARVGNTLTAFSSTDGKEFKQMGEPYPFADNLPGPLYVGLALTGRGAAKPGQAKFAEFKIEPR